MDPAGIDSERLNFSDQGAIVLNIILAIIMFGVALDLRPRDFRHVIETPRAPLIGLFAQFILLPAFTFLLTIILGVGPSIALGMILVASCPGGNMSNFITHLSKGTTALSVSITAVSTVAAIFMTPFNLAFWGQFTEGTSGIMREFNINPIMMLLNVLLVLGAPLAIGMSWAHYHPAGAKRIEPFFKYFSVVALLLFIIIAFASNWGLFLKYIGLVTLVVVIHNATALCLGYGSARLARLPRPDRRAVAIEVGIQNSGLGLTLIFTFFDGLGGMAVVAGFWGAWHIIAGLSLAAYWNWRDKRRTLAEAEAAA